MKYVHAFTGIELHNDAHFEGNGFLEFNRDLLDRSDQTRGEIIAFQLSTDSSDGLIFWHGQTPEQDGIGHDFIALAGNLRIYKTVMLLICDV